MQGGGVRVVVVGSPVLGAFPWQRNQPITVAGAEPRPWRCQLIGPEAERSQEFADLSVWEKVWSNVRDFPPAAAAAAAGVRVFLWVTGCTILGSVLRLYGPQPPPFQPRRSLTSAVLRGLTPLRCHSDTFNLCFFGSKSGIDAIQGITTPVCVKRWRPTKRRRGEPFECSSPVLIVTGECVCSAWEEPVSARVLRWKSRWVRVFSMGRAAYSCCADGPVACDLCCCGVLVENLSLWLHQSVCGDILIQMKVDVIRFIVDSFLLFFFFLKEVFNLVWKQLETPAGDPGEP